MKNPFSRINALVLITSFGAIAIAIAAAFIEKEKPAEAYPYDVIYTEDDYSQPTDSTYEMISNGEVLFKENCKTCHAVHTQEVGPALRDVSHKRSIKWIRQFIRNNEVLVRKKDTAAINLIKKFDYCPHTKFESMTNKEIDDILKYINTSSYNLVQPEIIIYD